MKDLKDARLTPEMNGIRYGLLTALGMLVYFVVATLLNLTERIEFSFFNGFILAVGVTLAIARFRQAKEDRMAYLQGFGTGIITALTSAVAFGLFFIVYALINPAIMEQISARDYFGFDLSVTIAFLAIILLTAMGGMIISLIAMQYFKSPDHKLVEGIE